jgi:hypothetical protein
VLRLVHCRALAALLKELSKTGLREVAFEIFDWLRSLNEQMHPEYAGLLDVFTYTTMIVSADCTAEQQAMATAAAVQAVQAAACSSTSRSAIHDFAVQQP